MKIEVDLHEILLALGALERRSRLPQPRKYPKPATPGGLLRPLRRCYIVRTQSSNRLRNAEEERDATEATGRIEGMPVGVTWGRWRDNIVFGSNRVGTP
jgi:hypothetical protein